MHTSQISMHTNCAMIVGIRLLGINESIGALTSIYERAYATIKL